MKFTRLGNSGLIVSRLSLGVMTFGSTSATDTITSVWKTGQSEADAIIHRALDSGVNLFDTADMYASGQSEEMLAKALGPRRKDIVLSTKVGFRSGEAVIQTGASFRYVVAATEASLRRLRTDYVDVLSIHKIDPFTPFEETARALDNLVSRGLVRYVGFSNFSAWQAAKFLGIQKQYNYSPFISAQMYYSLVGRDLEHEIAPFCQDAGVGIMVWSPLAGGFLTGRYSRQDPSGGKGRLSDFSFIPIDREKGYDLIGKLQAIGKRHNASVSQIALAWLLEQPFVTTVLLGASKVSQLEDNLGAEQVKLSPEELSEIDSITRPAALYPNWFKAATLDSTAHDALNFGTPAEKLIA